MGSKKESNSSAVELQPLHLEKSTPVIKSSDKEYSKLDTHDDKDVKLVTGCQVNGAEDLDVNTHAASDSHGYVEIRISKNKKISINKYLIPLRIAQILWFGAGRIPAGYLFVFLNQKGLTLIELSSIYSFAFLMNSATSFISGIIADKIGNAKPVLLFHMLATLTFMFSILLAPNADTNQCSHQNMQLNDSHMLKNSQNITYDAACLRDTKLENIGPSAMAEVVNATGKKFFESIILNNTDTNAYSSEFLAINITDILIETNFSIPCLSSSNDCRVHRSALVAIYSALVLCYFSVSNAANRLIDFTSITITKRYGSNFGKERSVAIAGELSVQVLASLVFFLRSTPDAKNDYAVMFWISTPTMFLAAVSVYCIRVHILPPGQNLTAKGLKLIRNLDVLTCLLVVFVAGNGLNFSSNFQLWFLDNLNAPKALISFYPLVSCLYALPVTANSKWLLRKLGTTKIFVLGLLCYTISHFSFSILYEPLWSLLLSLTFPFSYYLFWIAVVENGQKIAPIGFGATVNAMMGFVHFGLGRSTAVSTGGLLVDFLGIRTTFRIMATSYLVTATAYSIFVYFRQPSNTQECKKNNKKTEEKLSSGTEQEV